MLLYRVENLLLPATGLWYNAANGKASNTVHNLDLSNRNLPMDFDSRLAEEQWRSAADSVDQLKFWFTKQDLQKLLPLGFHLYEIDADITKIHKVEGLYEHPLFQERGVKSRVQLDINKLLKD